MDVGIGMLGLGCWDWDVGFGMLGYAGFGMLGLGCWVGMLGLGCWDWCCLVCAVELRPGHFLTAQLVYGVWLFAWWGLSEVILKPSFSWLSVVNWEWEGGCCCCCGAADVASSGWSAMVVGAQQQKDQYQCTEPVRAKESATSGVSSRILGLS